MADNAPDRVDSAAVEEEARRQVDVLLIEGRMAYLPISDLLDRYEWGTLTAVEMLAELQRIVDDPTTPNGSNP